MRLHSALAVALLGALGAIALALTTQHGHAHAKATPPQFAKPNIVVIQMDDAVNRDIHFMPKSRRLLGSRGATLGDYNVSFPLCCPSRSTLLTGQYAHNHGVLANGGPHGGVKAFDDSHALPLWMQSGGYRTAWIGKYLNGYGTGVPPTYIPPGWNEWYVGSTAVDMYSAYDYRMNVNGGLVRYGHKPRDYQTDVLFRYAGQFIRRDPSRPYFLALNTFAPHLEKTRSHGQRNPRPAPRDRRLFRHLKPPHPPSFNELNVSDKPRSIRRLPLLDRGRLRKLTRLYRARVRSVQAVDDGVQKVIKALRDSGELANTYVFLTSDNGFMLGQHRIARGKIVPYTESTRVPLLVRGPGIRRHSRRGQLVSNVDLASTFAEIGDVAPQIPQDGSSMLPMLQSRRSLKKALLLEDFDGKGRQHYAGIRTQNRVLVDYRHGRDELYDLKHDPHELHNRFAGRRHPASASALRRKLAKLRRCKASACISVR